MNKDDNMLEYNASSMFGNLFEIANTNDDGGDKCFDIIEEMEGAKSEPNLGIVKEEPLNDVDNFEENKENFAADHFFDQNINVPAHQLIRSAKKSRMSKITVEGIELVLPRIKHHAMITRLDEEENTPKIELRSRSVVKSEYKYEHIFKSGSQDNLNLHKSSKKFIAEKGRNFFNNTPPIFRSKPTVPTETKVFKSRKVFTADFETVANNINIDGNISVKIESNINNQNVNSLIPTSAIKVPVRSQNIKVLNSHDVVPKVEYKAIAHGGIKVPEKKIHTISKPFSFESRKLCAVKKTHNVKEEWTFKARPATVLKKKPFIPTLEKKYTRPRNIHLNTERRAQEWMIFEQEIKDKYSHYDEIIKMNQERNKQKEMDLIKNMRQQTIHKAGPIKKYKPVLIKKSDKPETVPHSPNFSTRPIRSGFKF